MIIPVGPLFFAAVQASSLAAGWASTQAHIHIPHGRPLRLGHPLGKIAPRSWPGKNGLLQAAGILSIRLQALPLTSCVTLDQSQGSGPQLPFHYTRESLWRLPVPPFLGSLGSQRTKSCFYFMVFNRTKKAAFFPLPSPYGRVIYISTVSQ